MERFRRFSLMFLALAFLGLLGIVGLMVVYLPTPKVTRSNCEKIREGMTEEEVEAILGGARNTFLIGGGNGTVQEFWAYQETGRLPPWEPYRIFATVHFNKEGKVEKVDSATWERTWKERLKDCLPW
jgi:hypothetical protein